VRQLVVGKKPEKEEDDFLEDVGEKRLDLCLSVEDNADRPKRLRRKVNSEEALTESVSRGRSSEKGMRKDGIAGEGEKKETNSDQILVCGSKL